MTGLIRRRAQRRLRRIMRGYRRLIQTGQLDRIAKVKRALTHAQIEGVSNGASTLLFGAGRDSAELVVRQYLLARVAGIHLNKALLESCARPGSAVFYPLPPEWRHVLRSHGFRLPRLRSAALWNGYVVLLLGVGIISVAKRLARSILGVETRAAPGGYAYFEGLNRGNLPEAPAGARSHDIISWYAQWPGRQSGLERLCHSVTSAGPALAGELPVTTASGPIPRLDARGCLLFVGWGITATALGIADIIRGRWWHAFMLREASAAAAVRIHDPHRLARDYLFSQSGWIYRPLWTYDAERKGSRISFYFYSTNNEGFKLNGEHPAPYFGWEATTWPAYMVWNGYQEEFVRRVAGDAPKVHIVGPIWYAAGVSEIPRVRGPAVAVFDVTPVRDSIYQTLGLDFEYFIPATTISFLDDVQRAAQGAGFEVLWKRKREIGTAAHPHYRAFANELEKCGNVRLVDPRVSAFTLIEVADLVISMPYTSTALIGWERGKPSCYYDATGVLDKNDRARHGVPIVSGREELENWMAANAPPRTQQSAL